MRTASPLRYPGGKSSLAGVLGAIRRLNGLGGRTIAEPFAGGAGASLSLLYLEETANININDADPAVYDFWWSLLHQPDQFLGLLSNRRVSMAEWRRQRDIYRSSRASRLRRGFATFYLNRCNRSGIIINGGPIGGVKQTGKWKLGARFNKEDLRFRCKRIFDYQDRIHLSQLDGIEFIRSLDAARTFYFIDPPYFDKSQTLYLNTLTEQYHVALARQLRTMRDGAWVLTYDDCPEVRELYQRWANVRPFELKYTAAARRNGREVLITPRWMRLPDDQYSDAIAW